MCRLVYTHHLHLYTRSYKRLLENTLTMPRIIPELGKLPSATSDAREVYNLLQSGGVAIIPTEVGYGIVASSAEGIERAFAAKQRKAGHTVGVLGTWNTHRQLHVLPDQRFEISRVITEEFNMVLAVVAPYRKDHERLRNLDPVTKERMVKGDTLGIAILQGSFGRELGRMFDENSRLMIGSSANLTGKGQKFRVEDIEEEIRDCADLIVDYGLQRYHIYGRAGTNIDLDNMRVLRIGAGYELFRLRLQKWFGINLPEDPDYPGTDQHVGVSIKLQD